VALCLVFLPSDAFLVGWDGSSFSQNGVFQRSLRVGFLTANLFWWLWG